MLTNECATVVRCVSACFIIRPGAVARFISLSLILGVFCALVTSPVAAQARDGREGTPLEVTVAVPRHFPPRYLLDEENRPRGFAVEVMDGVARLAGVRVKYMVRDTWMGVNEALHVGSADFIPNIGITEARRRLFDFTSPVETFPVSVFVRRETQDIKGKADLAGRKVAVVKTMWPSAFCAAKVT